MFSAFNCSNFR